MSKLFTPKGIIAVVIPLTIALIQILLRYLKAEPFLGTVGITLSSIGIGQIFPFIIFENFLLSKVFSLKEEAEFGAKGEIKLLYKIENKADAGKLKEMRLLSYIFFVLNILIFIFTIVLSLTGEVGWHIVTGVISCILTWYYNIIY